MSRKFTFHDSYFQTMPPIAHVFPPTPGQHILFSLTFTPVSFQVTERLLNHEKKSDVLQQLNATRVNRFKSVVMCLQLRKGQHQLTLYRLFKEQPQVLLFLWPLLLFSLCPAYIGRNALLLLLPDAMHCKIQSTGVVAWVQAVWFLTP